MININEKFNVPVYRADANFDRASDAAYQYALMFFEIDEYGNSTKIKNFNRSTDSIEIKFLSYHRIGNMGGQLHIYEFQIWVGTTQG